MNIEIKFLHCNSLTGSFLNFSFHLLSSCFRRATHSLALREKNQEIEKLKLSLQEACETNSTLVDQLQNVSSQAQNESNNFQKQLALAKQDCENSSFQQTSSEKKLRKLAERVLYYQTYCVCVSSTNLGRKWIQEGLPDPLDKQGVVRRFMCPWRNHEFPTPPPFVRMSQVWAHLKTHEHLNEQEEQAV